MKYFFTFLLIIFFFVACSSDSSSSVSALNPNEELSSSCSVTESSSSVKMTSSSSVVIVSSSSSSAESESSYSMKMSSSNESPSSSSVKTTSSSSVVIDSSSSCNENGASVDPSTVVTGTMIDNRDGQTYRTVKIGDQTWMAENLNYRYLGATTVHDSSSFCYNNDPTNCAKYGRLYFWSAAMDSVGLINGNTANGCGYGLECSLDGTVQGVCPLGWHLPSKAEWEELIVAVDGSITEFVLNNMAGPELKSASGWNENGNGTDSFGFSALPAGWTGAGSGGSYMQEGDGVWFWSSTEYDSEHAYFVNLFYDKDNALLYHHLYKFNGFSVRCLKDEETP